jgi:NAD(P)-dependent dehydrogenase (short-subunit alcohol dehydrogenase family)
MTDLRNKVAIITGANTGIGKETAKALAKMGAELVLACRDRGKTEVVIEEIRAETKGAKVEFLELELGSFESVRRAAKTFLDAGRPLHLLINNAGFAGKRGLTKEGFELTFGVNHLGHFLFTMLLLDRIKQSAPARIINVASGSHYQAKKLDFDLLRRSTPSRTGLPEYAVSKLCNILFTKELARRLEGSGVGVYTLHPGVVASDAWRQIPWPIRPLIKTFMISVEDGAKTTIYCATSDDVQSGLYYDDSKVRRPSRLAEDAELARKLWDLSEQWTASEVDPSQRNVGDGGIVGRFGNADTDRPSKVDPQHQRPDQ